MELNGTYDGILGLNFCKRYHLLDQSPLFRRLLSSSGKVLTGNDVAVPTTPPPVSHDAKISPLAGTDVTVPMRHSKIFHKSKVSQTPVAPQPSAITTKFSAIPSSNSVSLGAAETASYAEIIAQLKNDFAEVFCDKLGDVADFPSITKTKSGVRFEIILKPNATPSHAAPYRVPETLLPRFREMIAEHLNAGRLRYSSSPWASPAFLVKKPNGQHRLVCDFRALNNQTVPDMYPMGNIQDILHRAARRGNLFAKLDCKDAFFQTLMKDDDIHKTAITTPLGLLEWVVMPQGIRNAPAAQQRRINEALQGLAGECCEAYVDDIIIWGTDSEDLRRNCVSVLAALRRSGLRCSREKSQFYLTETSFLGHVIRPGQILPDPTKIARIEQFPHPTTPKALHSFLGLLNYLREFIPSLATHASVLHACLPPNTAAEKAYYRHLKEHKGRLQESWQGWRWNYGPKERVAFDALRRAVSTVPCLTTIDYDAVKAGTLKVFLTTDASKVGMGAWIGVSTTKENAQPVAYDSRSFNSAQRNYSTHERELLAIVHSLDHWRPFLYGIPVYAFTDHFTLKWFLGQRNLSSRQIRWLDILKDFDVRIEYIKGEHNVLADHLSRHIGSDTLPPTDPALPEPDNCILAPVVTFAPTLAPELIRTIAQGYDRENLFKDWLADPTTAPGVSTIPHDTHTLLLLDNRLCIPDVDTLHEDLMHQAHEGTAAHLGIEKTVEVLRDSYFWEGLVGDVREFVRACHSCQQANASTKKPVGPLHPLPVPRDKFDDIAMDFVGPLPSAGGHDYLLTITDWLTGFIELVPCSTTLNARDLALLFWNCWVSRYGLPLSITSDRDALFTSRFWTTLWDEQGVRLKMSTAFHPQTDGTSERSNKTVGQLLRSWVNRQGTSWAKFLPRISQAMNNTVRRSTGYSPIQLVFGRRLRTLPGIARPPPFTRESVPTRADWTAAAAQQDLFLADAQDNLVLAKHRMATQANRHRRSEIIYNVGDWVWLDTRNRLKEFKSGDGDFRAAKFFPRFQGSYKVLAAHSNRSVYTLDLPDSPSGSYTKFHANLLKPYLSSSRFHQTSPLTSSAPSSPSSSSSPRLLQILDDREFRGRRQLRVVFSGNGPTGQWRYLDDLRPLAGFQSLYEEYLGPDDLAI